jgi:hypothetical protein
LATDATVQSAANLLTTPQKTQGSKAMHLKGKVPSSVLLFGVITGLVAVVALVLGYLRLNGA